MLDANDIQDLFKGRTVSIARVGKILVVAHSAQPLDAEEWTRYCQVVSRHHAKIAGQLVVAEGPGPDATQRQQAIDEYPKGIPIPPTAVLTRSALVRGVVTIYNWFSPRSMRAFAPDDISGAARQLNVAPEHMRDLVDFALSIKPA